MTYSADSLATVYGFSDEHHELGQLAFKIASKYGSCSFNDHDSHRRYWDELCTAGFAGMAIPERFGGSGRGLLEMCIVTERTAAAGFPAAKLVLSQAIVGSILLRSGSKAHQEAWLPRVASGEVEFCFALTEADAGSNAPRMRTKAVPYRDGWVVTGEKTFITAVDEASAMLLAANTPDRGGITLFLIEDPRSRIPHEQVPMGFAMYEKQWTLHLDDLYLKSSCVVGEPGHGLRALFDGLNPERLLTGSQAIGLGRWGIAKATEYASQRVVFDAPIGSYQAVQHPLAESLVQLEAAWALTIAAARAYDSGTQAGVESNSAKVVATDAGFAALDRTLQTFGGAGYMEESRIIERFNVARLLKTAPITREMALNQIAMQGLGLPRSY